MNTDDLVARLSRDARRQPTFAPAVPVFIAAVAALFVATILSIVWLRPRADLFTILATDNHTFLLKIAFTFAVVFSALPIIRDLAVPGRRLGNWSLLAFIPFVVVGILALNEKPGGHTHGTSHHADLSSWLECLWQIPALAIPAFAILLIVVRSLAPTNLRLTGAYVGLAAGGIGAVGYVFHCDHDSMAFIAMFYSLAIFEMTVLGALFGPRVLRWAVTR